MMPHIAHPRTTAAVKVATRLELESVIMTAWSRV